MTEASDPGRRTAGSAAAWSACGSTHVGLVRRSNQDSWLAAGSLFAVADGMGGHAHGELASRLIVEELGLVPAAGSMSARIAAVQSAIGRARDRLGAVPGAALDGSGSTVAVLLVDGREAALLWAGDSRIYRRRGDVLERLTRDHSVVQEMVEAGQISEAEAQTHPLRNRLTRAIGTSVEVSLEQRRIDAAPGDRFLLCTDGLHQPVPQAELVRLTGDASLDEAVRTLIEAALARGARDNVTAVLAEPPAAGPPGANPPDAGPPALLPGEATQINTLVPR